MIGSVQALLPILDVHERCVVLRGGQVRACVRRGR